MKAIIDIAAVYWRNWHLSEQEEVSVAARKTLSFVRGLYGKYGVNNIIVALDYPPYKRSELSPEYKANRPQKNEAAVHEYRNAINQILEDGITTAKCEGYEADDVIATLVNSGEYEVYGTDKDLLQCTDLIEPYTGKIKTSQNTLGVERGKVVDYLALVGDTSDNIKGVNKVGPKGAVALIEKFGGVKGVYDALAEDETQFKPAACENLKAAREWIDKSYQLVKLADNLNLEVERREAKEEKSAMEEIDKNEEEIMDDVNIKTVKGEEPVSIQVSHEQMSFKQSLEPIGLTQLWKISQAFINSKMYSKFPTAEAAMVTIMRGRALGLDATTAMDGINVIQGKPTMSASLMLALVLSSPQCEYMYCDEINNDRVVWVAKRRGNPKETRREFTSEHAKNMGLLSKDNWKKQKEVMLQWRGAAAIIRQLFPDIINGIYATEEFE
jgi:5'-3' exonuclease